MLSISQIKDRLNLSEQFIHIWLTAGGLHSCPKTHPYVFTRVSFQRPTLDKDMNAEEVRETLVLQCSSPGTERAGVLAASALKSHYSFRALHLL